MSGLIASLATDWRLTKKRHRDRITRLRNYHYLRARGFSRRAAWFCALDVI